MKYKFEPEVEEFNDTFPEELDEKSYWKGISFIDEYGYEPVEIKVKRTQLPSFKLGVPVKLLADWDAEVKDCDMIMKVRRKIGSG